jgi:hypothetical protein
MRGLDFDFDADFGFETETETETRPVRRMELVGRDTLY